MAGSSAALRDLHVNTLSATRRPAKQLAAKPLWAAPASPTLGGDDALAQRLQQVSLAPPRPEQQPGQEGGIPAGAVEEEPAAQLAGEDSTASTATGGAASQLDSPLAAFAAAKARLARSTTDADSLISSTLAALGGLRHGVAAAAAARAPGSVAVGRLRQEQALEVAGGLPALAALQKRNCVLKERLHSTMDLCRSLHAQNQESLGLVSELRLDNQRLSSSLREARVDKACLQRKIRQLTTEAALLAEQAQRALLPGQRPSQPVAAPAAPAAAPAAAAAWHELPGLAAERCEAAPAPLAVNEGLTLVRDWSSATSSSSSSSASSGLGVAWQPAACVRSFECGGGASYAQHSAAGDKRRRLTPGMLAHCLRPAVAEAVAEAAALDSGGGGRAPTPGRAGKRKLRQLGCGSPAAAAAPDAATPGLASPAGSRVAGAGPAAAPAALSGPTVPVESGACQALSVPEPKQRYKTFELFDALWHGGGQLTTQVQVRAVVPADCGRLPRRRPGCAIM